MFPHSWNHRVLRILTNQEQVSEYTKTFNTSLTGHKVIRDDFTKMSELHSFLSTVLKIFITICKYTDLKPSKDILFSLIFLPYRRLSYDISGDVVSFRDYWVIPITRFW